MFLFTSPVLVCLIVCNRIMSFLLFLFSLFKLSLSLSHTHTHTHTHTHCSKFKRDPTLSSLKEELMRPGGGQTLPLLRWRVSKLIFAPTRKRPFPFWTKQTSMEWQTALELKCYICLLYTSPSPRDATLSRMPSSA